VHSSWGLEGSFIVDPSAVIAALDSEENQALDDSSGPALVVSTHEEFECDEGLLEDAHDRQTKAHRQTNDPPLFDQHNGGEENRSSKSPQNLQTTHEIVVHRILLEAAVAVVRGIGVRILERLLFLEHLLKSSRWKAWGSITLVSIALVVLISFIVCRGGNLVRSQDGTEDVAAAQQESTIESCSSSTVVPPFMATMEKRKKLLPGSTLFVGDRLWSKDERRFAELQPDGRFVIRRSAWYGTLFGELRQSPTSLFDAPTDSSSTSPLLFVLVTKEGKLITCHGDQKLEEHENLMEMTYETANKGGFLFDGALELLDGLSFF